ncbi:MAG: hypothetical protein CMQ54_04680 [Gammaproteobacteria bacterium]|nr:hypothetical protein [Gammaproteobacteria bacterium]|tara:strand:+ start:6468 stop:7037 length:570 start_codon:yes stop_codon:yes gene_type:complete
MATNVLNALAYIVNAFTSLYLLVLLLRFWLPLLHADFRNPIAQGIFKLTSPIVFPLRRFMPSIGQIDTATIFISVFFQCITMLLLMYISDGNFSFQQIFFASIVRLMMLSINIFTFAIFIQALMSWLSPPGHYNPIASIINTLSDTILRPLRRFVPILGGIDLTPVFAVILLIALNIFISGLLPIGIII